MFFVSQIPSDQPCSLTDAAVLLIGGGVGTGTDVIFILFCVTTECSTGDRLIGFGLPNPVFSLRLKTLAG